MLCVQHCQSLSMPGPLVGTFLNRHSNISRKRVRIRRKHPVHGLWAESWVSRLLKLSGKLASTLMLGTYSRGDMELTLFLLYPVGGVPLGCQG